MAAVRPHTAEDPPPYSPREYYDAGEIVEAVILVLSRTFIHAESAANVPIYQLSRDLGGLGDSELTVSVERLHHKVRVDADGTPHLKRRSRHIFDLKHLPTAISPNFPYCLDWATRRAGGDVALRTPSSFHRSMKLVRTKPKKEDDFPKGYHARRRTIKEVGQLFEIQRRNENYVWLDPKGKAVAVEDEEDGQQKLMIVAPLSREVLDALVGGWCLRIWHDLAKAKHDAEHQGWKNFVRGASSSGQVLPVHW